MKWNIAVSLAVSENGLARATPALAAIEFDEAPDSKGTILECIIVCK